MNVLLVTLGSHGDIHPFIAIARALKVRGHRPTLATNPYFQSQIEQAGVEFAPLTERAELKQIIADNNVMDPVKGPMVVMRKLVLPFVPQFVERIRELIREHKPDVVVYHPIVIGAAWACELEGGVPTASVSPSPLMWANAADQLVLLSFRSHTPRPREVRFDMFLGSIFMRFLMDPGLNRIRRELGLRPRRGNFHQDCVGADLNLGIWSPLFRAPLPNDPRNSVVTGFCWHDRDQTQQVADGELDEFFDAGPPPIVFALGSTGVHAAGRFFEHAVVASRRLKRRALLVIGRDQPPPKAIAGDQSIKAVAYAPFSAVFPRASVVVHHGGAGTTAQALAAGRPTLITPMAHDQFDNAARMKRLGTSETLRFGKVNAINLEQIIHGLLSNPSFEQVAAKIGPSVGAEDGAARAAEAIARCVHERT